jgi:hypothetical protein
MQFPIPDRAAVLLAKHFYRYVADGRPIDAALTSARSYLYAADYAVEWGAPVLYMESPDGRLFDLADTWPESVASRAVATTDAVSPAREILLTGPALPGAGARTQTTIASKTTHSTGRPTRRIAAIAAAAALVAIGLSIPAFFLWETRSDSPDSGGAVPPAVASVEPGPAAAPSPPSPNESTGSPSVDAEAEAAARRAAEVARNIDLEIRRLEQARADLIRLKEQAPGAQPAIEIDRWLMELDTRLAQARALLAQLRAPLLAPDLRDRLEIEQQTIQESRRLAQTRIELQLQVLIPGSISSPPSPSGPARPTPSPPAPPPPPPPVAPSPAEPSRPPEPVPVPPTTGGPTRADDITASSWLEQNSTLLSALRARVAGMNPKWSADRVVLLPHLPSGAIAPGYPASISEREVGQIVMVVPSTGAGSVEWLFGTCRTGSGQERPAQGRTEVRPFGTASAEPSYGLVVIGSPLTCAADTLTYSLAVTPDAMSATQRTMASVTIRPVHHLRAGGIAGYDFTTRSSFQIDAGRIDQEVDEAEPDILASVTYHVKGFDSGDLRWYNHVLNPFVGVSLRAPSRRFVVGTALMHRSGLSLGLGVAFNRVSVLDDGYVPGDVFDMPGEIPQRNTWKAGLYVGVGVGFPIK